MTGVAARLAGCVRVAAAVAAQAVEVSDLAAVRALVVDGCAFTRNVTTYAGVSVLSPFLLTLLGVKGYGLTNLGNFGGRSPVAICGR